MLQIEYSYCCRCFFNTCSSSLFCIQVGFNVYPCTFLELGKCVSVSDQLMKKCMICVNK